MLTKINPFFQFSYIYIGPNNNNSHIKALYTVRLRHYNNTGKTPAIKQTHFGFDLATVGKKIFLLTGRKNQAQGGAASAISRWSPIHILTRPDKGVLVWLSQPKWLLQIL